MTRNPNPRPFAVSASEEDSFTVMLPFDDLGPLYKDDPSGPRHLRQCPPWKWAPYYGSNCHNCGAAA